MVSLQLAYFRAIAESPTDAWRVHHSLVNRPMRVGAGSTPARCTCAVRRSCACGKCASRRMHPTSLCGNLTLTARLCDGATGCRGFRFQGEHVRGSGGEFPSPNKRRLVLWGEAMGAPASPNGGPSPKYCDASGGARARGTARRL